MDKIVKFLMVVCAFVVVAGLLMHYQSVREAQEAEIAKECINAGKEWTGWMGGSCKEKLDAME